MPISDEKQNFISLLKEKISNNLTDIESRDDLSIDEKSKRIIHIFSAACAVSAVQPIPFADIFFLIPLQVYMVERLAVVRDVPISALDQMTDFATMIVMLILAQQVALGLYKTGLPFFAGFTTIPLVYALTYGIAKVLDSLFVKRAKAAAY